MDTHNHNEHKVTCGNCERSWCERCDPAPSALCHWCHGRGHSDAMIIDADEIAADADDAADKLHRENKPIARKQHNCHIFSRGFEFLSLDENGERDENVIDYCDREEMSGEVVQGFIDDVRKAGSTYLAIGYGIDASESQEYYDAGDYEPMFDWVDLDNIAVR